MFHLVDFIIASVFQIVASLFVQYDGQTKSKKPMYTTQKLSMTEIYYKFNICLFNQSMIFFSLVQLRYFFQIYANCFWLCISVQMDTASVCMDKATIFEVVACEQHEWWARGKKEPSNEYAVHCSNYVHISGLCFSNTIC